MSSTPLISVLMSVYNGERFLAAAVESVLKQTLGDFEFIVIDDGSTDRTLEILRSYEDPRMTVISRENRGLARSLNEGLGVARAEYVARMDADDLSMPRRFEIEAASLDADRGVAVLGSQGTLVDEDGERLASLDMPRGDDAVRRWLDRCASPCLHGSTMFRRSVVLAAGGYPEDLPTAEDWMLWRRVLALGRVTNVPEELYARRLTADSITTLSPSMAARRYRLLRRAADEGGTVDPAITEELDSLKRGYGPRRRLAQYHLIAGKVLIERDWRPAEARRRIMRSLRADPLQPVAWANLVLTCMPRGAVRRWKGFRAPREGDVA